MPDQFFFYGTLMPQFAPLPLRELLSAFQFVGEGLGPRHALRSRYLPRCRIRCSLRVEGLRQSPDNRPSIDAYRSRPLRRLRSRLTILERISPQAPFHNAWNRRAN